MARKKSDPKKTSYTEIYHLYHKSKNLSVVSRGVIAGYSKNILREIRRLQSITKNVIPKLPFSRLVKEILFSNAPQGLKVQAKALEGLQEAAEMYLTQLFEDANICAYHAKRVTLRPNDLQLVISIRGPQDCGYSTR